MLDDPGVGAEAQDGWTPPPGYARRRFREHRSWTPSAARGQSSPGANVLANYVSLAPTETLRREWHVMSDDEQSQLPSMGSLRGPRKSNTKAIRANPVRRPALRQARSRSTGPEASHRAQRCAGGDPLHGPALDNAPRLAGEAPARLELGSQRCPGGPPCHHRRCLEAAGRRQPSALRAAVVPDGRRTVDGSGDVDRRAHADDDADVHHRPDRSRPACPTAPYERLLSRPLSAQIDPRIIQEIIVSSFHVGLTVTGPRIWPDTTSTSPTTSVSRPPWRTPLSRRGDAFANRHW